jgi:hypothetical protein
MSSWAEKERAEKAEAELLLEAEKSRSVLKAHREAERSAVDMPDCDLRDTIIQTLIQEYATTLLKAAYPNKTDERRGQDV